MNLFVRDGFYHINYFDEFEQRRVRISTKCNKKSDALKFIANLNKQHQQRKKVLPYHFKSLENNMKIIFSICIVQSI